MSASSPEVEPQVESSDSNYFLSVYMSFTQDHLTETQLFACSKVIRTKQLPLLEKALLMTDQEITAIMTQYSKADRQAYHMMITWHAKPHNNSKQKLMSKLNAARLYEAAKR